MNVKSRSNIQEQHSLPTQYMLLGQYGHRSIIPLEEVCLELFGLAYKTAVRKANLNELPVPVVRLNNSQKAPWMVHLSDLANFIDDTCAKARTAWRRSQV